MKLISIIFISFFLMSCDRVTTNQQIQLNDEPITTFDLPTSLYQINNVSRSFVGSYSSYSLNGKLNLSFRIKKRGIDLIYSYQKSISQNVFKVTTPTTYSGAVVIKTPSYKLVFDIHNPASPIMKIQADVEPMISTIQLSKQDKDQLERLIKTVSAQVAGDVKTGLVGKPILIDKYGIYNGELSLNDTEQLFKHISVAFGIAN